MSNTPFLDNAYFMLFAIYSTYKLKYKQIISTSILFIILTACNTLPPQRPILEQSTPQTPLSPNKLSLKLAPLRQQYPNLTGYRLLVKPEEALSARLSLIENAEQNIDIQYYIWEHDQIGALFFDALLKAGDRGVKIRLLIDDNNAKKIEGILLALDEHQNIHVKLFNPYRFRKYRAIDMILDTKRINRRMHNKSLIIDNELSIIGGRNIGNQYFNLGQKFQFADIDVLLAGKANDEVKQSFDTYWLHDYSYDIRQIVKAQHHKNMTYQHLKQQVDDYLNHLKTQETEKYKKIQQNKQLFHHWKKNVFKLTWVEAQVFVDNPDKVKKDIDKNQYVLPQLMSKIPQPHKQLDIISAYFIPQKQGTNYLKSLEERGVNVRIITNSLHSTDVKGVHAYYSIYREDLLNSGVELYEFLPVINVDDFVIKQAKINNYNNEKILQKKNNKSNKPNNHQPSYRSFLSGSSNASLHAKALVIDRHYVFVGSMNIDPRSFYYNTEIGVLLKSPVLATNVHHNINETVNQYTWHLILNAEQQLRWVRPATESSPEIQKNTDPYSSRWHRFLNAMLRALPLEKYF